MDQYGQGSAQEERVRSKAVYLSRRTVGRFVQRDAELRISLGIEFAADGPGSKSADLYSWAELHHLSLPAFVRIPSRTSQSLECQPRLRQHRRAPNRLVVPGDKGFPRGLTPTYYKSFAPRIGLARSPRATDGILGDGFGGPGQDQHPRGIGIFYNPVEQLVLNSSARNRHLAVAVCVSIRSSTRRSNTKTAPLAPNPFNGILTPPPGGNPWTGLFSGQFYYLDNFRRICVHRMQEQYKFRYRTKKWPRIWC